MHKLFCRQIFWKTPYTHDFEPTWKASNGCCMVWCTAENAWFLITPYKKTVASCEAKLLNWGFDKMNLPDGLVKTPALNNSFGSKGEAKFRVLSCYAMELWQKKQKAPSFRAAARAAKSKAIARPKQVPEPKDPPKPRPSTKVIKALLKPKGCVAGAMPSNPASASGPSQPAYPPPSYTPTWPQAGTSPSPPDARPRQGWMMKTKELIVSYKQSDWWKFESLCAE